MIAYIPARGNSKRIPKKNIRQLYGKPVIGHVIENLRKLDFITDIFVSTEDKDVQKVAKSFGAETMGLRSPGLSEDNVGFLRLIQEDIPRFTGEVEKEVLFVLATASLVPPEVYKEAHSFYKQTRPQFLMSVMRYNSSPFKALTPKEDGFWRFIFPEKVSLMSQDLPKTVVDAGLFYFFNTDKLKGIYDISLIEQFQVYEVDTRYAVDVDTIEDWRLLEEKYRSLHQLD